MEKNTYTWVRVDVVYNKKKMCGGKTVEKMQQEEGNFNLVGIPLRSAVSNIDVPR